MEEWQKSLIPGQATAKPEAQGGKTAAPRPEEEKPKRDPDTIKTINELYKACNQDFGMQPKDVYAELNVKSASEIAESPAECYRKIAAVRTL